MAKNSQNKTKPLVDHRVIGRELDLFSFHEISPGAPFWHAKGMVIFKELEKFIRELQDKHDYEEISTPVMVKKDLFETSGHWKFFKEDMFYFNVDKEIYALKPMNCPESTIVYNSKIRSYKDLPLRLAEIGLLHRNELSGVLGGLLRVRQLTMDDAHIYCRKDQTKEELITILDMTQEFYKKLKLPIKYGLATRPKKAMGSVKTWDEAEKILGEALKERGLKYKVLKGEGAFYGPKIHFDITDSIGRTWTIATAQVDFQLPERFKLEYIDQNGKPQRPIIIHRAIFGSFERFIGILLEHTGGNLPLWLAPTQSALIPVSDKHEKYAEKIMKKLKDSRIRTQLFRATSTLPKRIREAETQKITYILVVGDKEAKRNSVSVRKHGEKTLKMVKMKEFIKKAEKEIRDRV